ncbi:MAG: Fe-S-containing hydro-lyase [Lachnospiraceae bacterium]|nr:Fe-S-containing hydro-lyase [Lachnospiraceae bacterium]
MNHRITVPASPEALASLRAGDTVLLSGTVYTARDAAHKRMTEALEKGEALPFPMKDSAVYYAGPTPEKPGQVIGSCGPTTSGRMDAYTPALLDLGQTVMIGKGSRNREVKDAIVRNGAVYFAAPGGAGAVIASCIRAAEVIAYEDLGCEAVRKLTVDSMPLVVAIDSLGNDLYEQGPDAYRKAEGQA